MEEIFKRALAQAPDLTVLAVLVVMGMRHMSKRDKEFQTFLREVHEEHLDERQRSKEAIQENSAVTRELTRSINELRVTVGAGRRT